MTTTMKKTANLLALAGAVAVLASCGGNDGITPPPTNNNSNSSFSATLAGALSGTFTGKSAYGSNAQGNFALVMEPAANQGIGIVLIRNAGKPGTGQYTFTDVSEGAAGSPEQIEAQLIVSTSGFSGMLVGKSGTLTISDTGGGRLKGTFQFTAVGIQSGASQPVQATVSGSFDAVNGQVTIP